MSIRRTIENNEEASIRPSKTYQSFVAAAGGHRELNFIEKDVRNYITREVRNVSEQEDAKEFGKYFIRSRRTSFQLNIQQVCGYLRLSYSQGKMPMLIIRVERDTVSSRTKRVKLRTMSPRYILERWSKKVKRRHTHIKSSHDEPLMEPRSKRFDQLVFRSQNICEFASELEELTAILHRAYDNVMAKMESLKAKRKGTSSLSHEDANLESVNELQSPPRIRTRGRPKNRLGSKLDKQIANATKKKKTKVLSEINLFDAASAVHSNSSQYQGHVMNYQFRVPAAGDNSLGV
ncbi:hypothetical protein Ahy_B01g054104 isoform A [Arachis hypogaea]|uniref:Protein FAR1-RELATED SEQUENCE n=1 Tax=Arachis hypogaea TaxID=3818 RepID=A0A445ATA1_ARAHY|nr:hypothetical protein Ahy_B01g054104 isoform A [Arachis hypogaea]